MKITKNLVRIRPFLLVSSIIFLIAGGLLFGVSIWIRIVIVGILNWMLMNVGRKVEREPVVVRLPFEGRWEVANSPGTKLPSHGVTIYGQSYAIDFAPRPPDVDRPASRSFQVGQPASLFPGFGSDVLAAKTGVVVRAHSSARDRSARTSALGILLFFVEGLGRSLGGSRWLFGNHVIVRTGDAEYCAYAHLRHESIVVAPGDNVESGQKIAECGNSGNSTEPHVHFQVMDHHRASMALGLPLEFSEYALDSEVLTGVPRNGQVVHTR